MQPTNLAQASTITTNQSASQDFWGVGDLPDVLANPNHVEPKSLDELTEAMQRWKDEDREVQISYMGQGRIGWGYGHFALVGSRAGNGVMDSTVYVLRAFDKESTARFAERHGILNFCSECK